MSNYMIYALVCYMAGVLIAKFLSREVGETLTYIGAGAFLICFLITKF